MKFEECRTLIEFREKLRGVRTAPDEPSFKLIVETAIRLSIDKATLAGAVGTSVAALNRWAEGRNTPFAPVRLLVVRALMSMTDPELA